MYKLQTVVKLFLLTVRIIFFVFLDYILIVSIINLTTQFHSFL